MTYRFLRLRLQSQKQLRLWKFFQVFLLSNQKRIRNRILWASHVARLVKNSPAMWGTWVRFLGWEDPLEKEKATHSSIMAWRIPWTGQSMGSQRVRTRLSDFHFLPVIVLNPSLLVTHFILEKFLSDRKGHLVTHHCLFLEGSPQVQPAPERRKIKLHLLEEDMLKDSRACS